MPKLTQVGYEIFAFLHTRRLHRSLFLSLLMLFNDIFMYETWYNIRYEYKYHSSWEKYLNNHNNSLLMRKKQIPFIINNSSSAAGVSLTGCSCCCCRRRLRHPLPPPKYVFDNLCAASSSSAHPQNNDYYVSQVSVNSLDTAYGSALLKPKSTIW